MDQKIRKVSSKQNDVHFSYCPHPVTIDKSVEWGDGNVQQFPNGVFLKHEENGSPNITHGVQPNEDSTAPVGWIKNHLGTYEKKPIFIGEKLEEGMVRQIDTLDGPIEYVVREPSIMCWNGDEEPNLKDCYIQPIKNLEANYFTE